MFSPRSDEKNQSRFKKRTPNQDAPSAPKANYKKDGGSQADKLNFSSGWYGCGKADHKVRDCPTLVTKGRETKETPSEGTVTIPPSRGHFYALQANKEANSDEGTCNL